MNDKKHDARVEANTDVGACCQSDLHAACAFLRVAVHGALRVKTSALCVGASVFLTSLATGVEGAYAGGAFPAVLDLKRLYPAQGGDGSEGFVLNGVDSLDYTPRSLSSLGDVNGDAIDDLLISSAVASPGGRSKAGETYVVFGRLASDPVFALQNLHPVAGGDGSVGFILNGIDAYDYSGLSASGAGDINGDGLNDLVIGASRADRGGLSNAGEAYVVFGRSTDFPAIFELSRLRTQAGGDGSRGFILRGMTESDNAGNAVSRAGDVNGDGIDDLLIAAYLGGPPNFPQGQAYVVFGRTTGFPAEFPLSNLDGSNGFVLQGIDRNGMIGRSVSAAGDVNGDGLDDVLIGSSNAQDNAGETYVVFGRAAGFPAFFPLHRLLPSFGGDGSAGFIVRGADDFDFAGYCVSGAGDVNGDGVDDIVIGATGSDPGRHDGAGASYLIFGRTTAFPPLFELRSLYPVLGGDGSEGVIFTGRYAEDRSGRSVSGAGDLNGDGIDDLVIGAYGAQPAGEGYVVFGRASGFPAVFELQHLSPTAGGDGSEGFIVAGANANDEAGWVVSKAGDVNLDGIGDLLIGAAHSDPGGRTSAGASYVVFGRVSGRR
jgi:hypothetical protein